MKKFVALFFVLFFSLSVALGRSFSVGFDFSSLDLLVKEDLRLDAELTIEEETFHIIFPLRYGRTDDDTVKYVESGILVSVKPIEGWNLSVEASFLKIGWIGGIHQPEDPWVLATEGSVCWDLRWRHLFLKPKLTIRNPLTTESEKNELVKRIRPFSDLRLSLVGGYLFLGGIYDSWFFR